MDPATMQQILQAIKGIKGEIPISDIILGLALAGLVGEKIWMAVLKAKALRQNGKNGGKTKQMTANCIVDKVLEEQAIQGHYKMTNEIASGVGRLCDSAEAQGKASVQMVTILGEIAENTRGLTGRRGS